MSQNWSEEEVREGNKKVRELYESQKGKGIRTEGEYKDGLKDGIWTEWYECRFRDRLDDLFKFKFLPWLPPREKISDHEAIAIKERLLKFGLCTKLVTNYNSGSKEGERIGYSDEEKLILKCNYKNGKLDGLYTEWWESGGLMLECNYKNGKLDGLYTEWGSGGKVELKCNYKNGVKDGENIIYNPPPIIMQW
jgi:antitoxin component YwqK of YwqJK toxin-antitoxin module